MARKGTTERVLRTHGSRETTKSPNRHGRRLARASSVRPRRVAKGTGVYGVAPNVYAG